MDNYPKGFAGQWTWKEAIYISFFIAGFEFFFSTNHQTLFSFFFPLEKGIEAKIFSLFYVLGIRICDLFFIFSCIFVLKKDRKKAMGISFFDLKKQLLFSFFVCLIFGLGILTIQFTSLFLFKTDVLKMALVPKGRSLFENFKYLQSYILVVVICAPLIEEIFFRGILYRAMRAYLPKILSICLNGLLFASVHGINTPYFFVQLTGGLLFALLYEKTDSIIPSYIVHSLGNFTIVGIICFYKINFSNVY